MEIILTGFVLGLITSLHCVGMCGPIALALPFSANSKTKKIFSGIIYNLGRTLTYVIAGVVFGIAGQGFNMLGFQQWISIISGTIIILFAIIPLMFNASIEARISKYSFVRFVRNSFQKVFSKGTIGSLFVIGLLNGLLPCGPLYAALVAAIGTGSVVLSALFMLLFGLGTIPMLFVVYMAGGFMNHTIRKKAKGILSITMVILGLLFILRGADLGIPFISPEKEKIESIFKDGIQDTNVNPEVHDCCSKK